MATNVNLGGNVGPTSGANAISPVGANSVSPLDRAKQIVTGMARSDKDAYWLGLRMENFLRGGVALLDRSNCVGCATASESAEKQCRSSLDTAKNTASPQTPQQMGMKILLLKNM